MSNIISCIITHSVTNSPFAEDVEATLGLFRFQRSHLCWERAVRMLPRDASY